MMGEFHHDDAVPKDRGDDFSRLVFALGPDRHLVAAGDEAFSDVAPATADSAQPDTGGGEKGTRERPKVQEATGEAQADPRSLANAEGRMSGPVLLHNFSSLKRIAEAQRQAPIWGNVRRRQVSLVVGQPGIGKSQYLAQGGIAMSAGCPFGGYMPSGAYRVILLSPEDEADILVDRIEAMAAVLGADMATVEQNLRIVHHEESCVLFEPGPEGARMTDMGRSFFAEVDEFGADVVCLDPMAELHRLPEMDNGSMHELMAKLRTLARLGNYAVVLTHHSVKPDSGSTPPSIHTARGASATGASIRHAEVFSELSKKEREDFGITDEAAPDYIRRDVVKASYRRRPGRPTYFRRVEVPANGATAPAMEMVQLQPRGR
jgi:RecA-family ATPase